MKFRLPDGRQVQRKVGPAWTGRGRPAAGYFTKRLAEDQLRDTLTEASRGTLLGFARTGVLFSEAVDEFLRYVEVDRARKPSTLAGYRAIARSQLLPAFGDLPLESITTPMIEAWVASMGRSAATRRLALVLLHGIFRRAMKVWGLPVNPAATAEKPPLVRSGDLEVFSPEEVWALVRAASSEQDAALFLTAAFTGLRMGELLALHWRDVDFAASAIRVRGSYSRSGWATPTSRPRCATSTTSRDRRTRSSSTRHLRCLRSIATRQQPTDDPSQNMRICREMSEDVPKRPKTSPPASAIDALRVTNPQQRRTIPRLADIFGRLSTRRCVECMSVVVELMNGSGRLPRGRGLSTLIAMCAFLSRVTTSLGSREERRPSDFGHYPLKRRALKGMAVSLGTRR